MPELPASMEAEKAKHLISQPVLWHVYRQLACIWWPISQTLDLVAGATKKQGQWRPHQQFFGLALAARPPSSLPVCQIRISELSRDSRRFSINYFSTYSAGLCLFACNDEP